MEKLFYRPEDAWVGDLIPYYENGIYYAFYLHDPRVQKDRYAEETTWHLVTTRDFSHLEYHGEAIPRGREDQPNRNCYTGSVIQGQDGRYYAFFTAFNEDYKIEGKAIQTVMRAIGPDLYHLRPDPEFLFKADDVRYEAFDWRDPFVFWNEEEACWWMILAARKKGAGDLRGGCLALCKSEDLTHWSYETPFYDPCMYITMECPEVFRMGKYWYLVFSTFSDRFVTHYRIAEDLKGPWRIPANDAFDTRANYAIKTASDGERRFAFGWIASRKGDVDFGPWEWGGTMVFHEIVQDAKTGELSVRPTEGMMRYYSQEQPKGVEQIWNAAFDTEKNCIEAETLGAVLYDVPEDRFRMDIRFEVEEAVEFGIALHASDDLEKGYYLRMNPAASRMAVDVWPRTEKGFYQWQIRGDIPYQVETERPLPKGPSYHVRIFREEDICVIYVNDEVALSTRMYGHKGKKAGLYLIQGRASLKEVVIRSNG